MRRRSSIHHRDIILQRLKKWLKVKVIFYCLSDFASKVKEGSEVYPKDLLEMLFFQNFNFQYFRDISDSASKRQETFAGSIQFINVENCRG